MDYRQVLQRTIGIVLVGAVATVFSAGISAGQGRYKLGMNADVTGGASGPEITGSTVSSNALRYVAFYGTYPSLHFDARGERSTFVSSYAFGYDKYTSDPSREDRSHSASATFSTKFGPRWSFNLSDSFSMTSDISTFRLLGGVTTNPDQFQFVFTPVFARSNQNNTANLSVSRTISQRSSLSFGGSYSTLFYPGGPAISGVLSDQRRISESVTYTHSGEHNTWSVGYSGAQFIFTSFQNSRNHSGILGYSHKFSPVLSLRIDVGPTYLETLENIDTPFGVNASASLERTVHKGSFSLTLNQTSGDTSGLGSLSSYRRATIAMSRTLGRSTTVSANISGFDSHGLQLNSASARGITAGGSLGVGMGRDWSMNFGGQYQHYEGYSNSGYDQNRIFVSLRYSKPDLWRF
jgi:hypothetical protein